MGKMKQIWIEQYEKLYNYAIEKGITEAEAIAYADEYVSVAAQSHLEELIEHQEGYYKGKHNENTK
mgnify:CR=1 FL=1